MNRKLLAVPVIVAALAFAVWWATRGDDEAQSRLLLHGNVDIRQVELAFDGSGRIDQVLVHEGARVAEGQLLARLDTVRLELALARAKALAAAQRSLVQKLRAGSRPEEVRQAAAQRAAARAAVEDARQFHARQQDLAARRFVSAQQVDRARHELDAAEARLRVAEEAHRLAVLGPRSEDVAAAEANLLAQEAAVAALEHDIAQGELKAPQAGIIENRILQPGDMASPQKPVFTLALTEPVWARVYLPETALGRVPTGARATITTDSHPGREFAGWVGYISPTAEFTPKTVETTELRTSLVYQARIFACAGQEALRQGMPVTVAIAYDQPAPLDSPCPGAE